MSDDEQLPNEPKSPLAEFRAWARQSSEAQKILRELPGIASSFRAGSPGYYGRFGLDNEHVLALVVAHDAEAVEHYLLGASVRRLLADRDQPEVVRWLAESDSYFDVYVWRRLRVPACVAAGVVAGRQEVREMFGEGWPGRWRAGHEADDESARPVLAATEGELLRELWTRLTVAALVAWMSPGRGRGLHETAARRRLETFADEHPEVWAESMPWLLVACQDFSGVLDSLLVLKVALGDRTFREAVELATEHPHRAVRTAAEGVLVRAGGADESDPERSLIEAAAAVLDRNRGRVDAFPRPLSVPAHTWLSDRSLEELMHDGAALALAGFREIVRDQGATEEDALTARLLERLEREFSKIDTELVLVAPQAAGGPEISLAQRPVRKADERTIGADVGLVVDVDLPSRMRVRLGELVQVKKSTRLHGVAGTTDSWRIETRQLSALLDHSPTAVYWLIQQTGDVLCVPAKLLHAIVEGRDKPGSSSLTVRYSEVRHAAIGLGQYLRDLVVGLWVGSCGEPTLGVASGANDRIRPMRVLDLRVRVRDEQG
ncbi:hypothetical protein [Lentzea albidocapillata]|uniref:Uncharacterized protein n=1 Tax=Lentzea albidocapillata TaxID=40571 RepID=A0A1W2FSJ9_9PSEU|nr:hypothetical protein [Lentzea albidocapillata]SMD24606.1 hypothetical protein SAMN05660733_07758 [Lentzea albidocapillata]